MLNMIIRYGLFPLVFVGGNALGIALAEGAAPLSQRLLALLGIIALMLWAERRLPYQCTWNRDHGDTWRDVAHAGINTALNYCGIWLLPAFASLGFFSAHWPAGWPFWAEVVFAILVLDIGVTLTHYVSHRVSVLWRFHAVHHSVRRMYGFNGLMKHPVHQTIETVGGIAPLLLLGVPSDVASAVVFSVALQLLLQHSNVDYRTGPFKYLFAIAEVHRFHHRKGAQLGDVNFGLFTTLCDHMMGTFYSGPHEVGPNDVGIVDRPDYPQGYVPQLLAPFRTLESDR